MDASHIEQRLPRFRRITHRQEFLRIQNGGRKTRASHFLVVYVTRDPRVQESRLGLTVTTKVNKRAVARNRLKRRLRELFRRELRLKLAVSVDIVVIALKGATELPFVQVRDEIVEALERTRLMAVSPPGRSRANRGH